MITRIFTMFLLFAGIAYYYNIDVRAVVDRSGVPEWLSAHGIAPQKDSASSTITQ